MPKEVFLVLQTQQCCLKRSKLFISTSEPVLRRSVDLFQRLSFPLSCSEHGMQRGKSTHCGLDGSEFNFTVFIIIQLHNRKQADKLKTQHITYGGISLPLRSDTYKRRKVWLNVNNVRWTHHVDCSAAALSHDELISTYCGYAKMLSSVYRWFSHFLPVEIRVWLLNLVNSSFLCTYFSHHIQ